MLRHLLLKTITPSVIRTVPFSPKAGGLERACIFVYHSYPYLDQNNIPSLHCHVRSCSYGDADVGFHQGGAVVDPVPHHGNALPLFLQLSDLFHLVVRQNLSKDLGYAHLVTDKKIYIFLMIFLLLLLV